MPGRSMVGRESLKLAMSVRFAPRQPDLVLNWNSRSGEGYGYFFGQKTPYLIVPSSQGKYCEVIQLDRIAGSDPVHAGSNPALAAKG
jgi:hypothetical protein